MNELEALLRLNHIALIGSVKIRLLINLYGSAQAALHASTSELASLPGFGPKILQAWEKGIHSNSWETDIQLVERYGVQMIPFTDARYPQSLLETVDFPLVLYVKGKVNLNYNRCLAVVGTRQASYYGMEMAQKISSHLASVGWTIVSGLARGIDTAAHQGALEKGCTWAVLGSGIASVYPKENERLAEAISQKGAVLSEFPMLTPPDRSHFPQRNRIVSGLSVATLLIEAPHQSGAMLTVERAIHQGRLIFALPGRADQENFKGNHRLIKEKKAQLVENAEDILQVIDPQTFNFQLQGKQSPKIVLEKEEEELLRNLPLAEELSVEEIVQRLQWPVAKLNVLLISLVLKRVIKEYPGKIYKKVYRDN